MANHTGIAIMIKASTPAEQTRDEQFKALSAVKAAHESGDYSELLKLAKVDEVKAEQTRRIEDQPQQQADPAQTDITKTEPTTTGQDSTVSDEDVPAFLKSDKKGKAA